MSSQDFVFLLAYLSRNIHGVDLVYEHPVCHSRTHYFRYIVDATDRSCNFIDVPKLITD